jgi:hypothetical protein
LELQENMKLSWFFRPAAFTVLALAAIAIPLWDLRSRASDQENVSAREFSCDGITDGLPRSWSLEEIEKQTPPYGAKGRVYVLAWKVMEDDRPLRVESCLVLKALDKNGYSLAHLYRHPADKKPEWCLSWLHITGEEGTKYFPGLEILHCKRFKNRPGSKELYASLSWEDVGWSFEQEEGWKFVSCCVCEKNWQAVTGEAPTQFFGR